MKRIPTTDPHQWTATETLEALALRKIGAEELLDHTLARLPGAAESVNAVVETNEAAARATAQAVDRGEITGPLAGLAMTVKDCYEAEGFTTTAGIPDLADYRPERDADTVARLRGAGAVIFGKTNVPLAASDHQSYNPIHGVTRNPWDGARSAGGSSGGSATALAAGLTPLELGSDIGGSIRVPAHYCGVYGHKPTYGIVSSRGHVPPGPGALTPAPLSVCGPLARSARDLALAMDILAGGHAGYELALTPSRLDSIRGARVVLWLDGFPLDDAYRAALSNFADMLEKEGAVVTRLSGPIAPVDPADDLYFRILFAVIGAGLPDEEVAGFEQAARELPDHPFASTIAATMRASVAEMSVLQERQAAHIARWRAVFEEADVVLAPVAMNTAFPHQVEDGHGPLPQLRRTLTVSGEERPYMENLLWPGAATLSHLPSTVRPLPELVNGLPAGVQMIGDLYGDRTTLAFAAACDRAFGTAPLAPDFR
jgi:amidase